MNNNIFQQKQKIFAEIYLFKSEVFSGRILNAECAKRKNIGKNHDNLVFIMFSDIVIINRAYSLLLKEIIN